MEKNNYLEELSKKVVDIVEKVEGRGIKLEEPLLELEKKMREEGISVRKLLNYPKFISLYSLKGFPYHFDKKLEVFFKRTNLFEEIDRLRTEIKNSKENLTDLQAEQISELIKYDALGEDKSLFSDYVIQQVIYGNHKFSYETLKQAYINVVDVTLANIEKGKECCVVKDLRNDEGEPLDGQKTSFGVLINEDGLKDLYERGDCTVIETAFHETFHIYQKKRLDDLLGESHVEKIAQMCGDDFLTIISQLKEKVLEKCDDNYYKNNYAFHTIETEANIHAKAMVIKYLDSLGILPPYNKEKIEGEIKWEIFKSRDKLREFKEQKASVDQLVLESQDSLGEIAAMYPVLYLVYTCDEEGNIVEKTKEDLQREYSYLPNPSESVTEMYRVLTLNAKSREKDDGQTRT